MARPCAPNNRQYSVLDESASKNVMYGTGIANTHVKAKARAATGGGERGIINEAIRLVESCAIVVQAHEER